jgi:hypothetical protein
MSNLACLPTVKAPYPPLKALPGELAKQAELDKLSKQASEKPFGQMTKTQYLRFVERRTAELKGTDFRWPFYVGVGAAALAVIALAAKR